MKNKVMIITQSEGGGLRRHLTDLMDGLINRGIEVVLVYNSDFADKTFDTWISRTESKLTKYDLKTMVRNISPVLDIKSVIAVHKIIRDERIAVVHAHSSKAGVIARVAAKLSNVNRVFYTPHAYSFLSEEFSDKKKNMFVLIERLLSRWFTAKTFNVSESEMQAALSVKLDKPEKFEVIPNAVPILADFNYDFERKRLTSSDKFVVVNTARVTKQKNPDLFVDLANRVKQDMPDVEFVWIGQIDSEYKNFVNEQTSVVFKGEMQKTNALVGAADLYLSTSFFEGLSYSLLEAGSFGIPVFLSNVPGNVDFAQMYNGAELFNIDDSRTLQVEKLEAFINKLRNKENTQSEITADYDAMIDKIVDNYYGK